VHRQRLLLLLIILIGGSAVLGSYVWGARTYPELIDAFWGGVPEGIRPAYTLGMFLGAAGYFAYTYFILFRLQPDQVRLAGRFGYSLFGLLYLLILIPSALWMPLTFLAIEQNSPALVWVVRFDLLLVALGSLGMLFALLRVDPKMPRWAHRLAVIGAAAFCFQTVLLDAFAWGINFGS
jgi:hypothetical protein